MSDIVRLISDAIRAAAAEKRPLRIRGGGTKAEIQSFQQPGVTLMRPKSMTP